MRAPERTHDSCVRCNLLSALWTTPRPSLPFPASSSLRVRRGELQWWAPAVQSAALQTFWGCNSGAKFPHPSALSRRSLTGKNETRTPPANNILESARWCDRQKRRRGERSSLHGSYQMIITRETFERRKNVPCNKNPTHTQLPPAFRTLLQIIYVLIYFVPRNM